MPGEAPPPLMAIVVATQGTELTVNVTPVPSMVPDTTVAIAGVVQ